MGDWTNLFPSTTVISASPIAPVETATSTVDLRHEFDNLVLGGVGEPPIGQTFILRRMRRDSSGDMQPCFCVDDISHEPDRDFPCRTCFGSGWLWDEELVTGYKMVASPPAGSNASSNFQKIEAGTTYLPSIKFFLPYDTDLTRDDRILELELDVDGDPVEPYNRIAVYEVMLVRAMRSNYGKIAFWVCNTQKMGPPTQGSIS
jgi:hypothetical protein